jgi:threonine dehydratase
MTAAVASPTDGAALHQIVGIEDIEAAAARLAGVARRTPLLASEALDAQVGGRLLIKPEPLQRTGSFKFRGAYNTIAQLPPGPVVAYSSGNHAQGVALAARLLGRDATIIMPADAPAIKKANTERLGATLVLYDRHAEDREAIGREIAERTGAQLVKPYDDPRIMAGQGTVGLEMALDAQALGIVPDAAIVCCGGGGLIAGTATALRHYFPEVAVYSAEPAGFDDTARSLSSGKRETNTPGATSICDALLAPMPGELTFAVNQRLLAGGLAVDDRAVLEAMRRAFLELKLVVEPGGAIALAAALAGALDCRDKTVLVVLSGGNVDPARFIEALQTDSPPTTRP